LVRVSDKAVKHIMRRHRDWIELLNLKTEEEVRAFIASILAQPDEIYCDRVRVDVRYFIRKLDSKFLCVVVVGEEVVTAYLISLDKYVKYKVGRWA